MKAGALFLLSAFYFQKLTPCLLAHSRCSVFIQCVTDRKVLWSLKFSLGSALLIFLYLCQFTSFLSSVDVHTLSRHNLRHEDISINIGSCFRGTRTSHFCTLGFWTCSRTVWTFSIIHFHFKERSFYLQSKGGDLPTFSPILIPLPFQATLVVPSVGVWLFQKREELA